MQLRLGRALYEVRGDGHVSEPGSFRYVVHFAFPSDSRKLTDQTDTSAHAVVRTAKECHRISTTST